MTATNKAIAQKMNNEHLLGNSSMISAAQNAARLQTAGNRSTPSGRDIVMMEFLRSSMEMTQIFMDSQERVLMAYLNGSTRMTSQGIPAAPAAQRSLTEFTPSAAQQALKQIDFKPALEQINLNSLVPISSYESSQPNHNPSHYSGGNGNGNGYADDNGNGNGKGAKPGNTGSIQPELRQIQAAQSVKSPDTEMTSDQLIAALIDIVSQRTGYPPEMLDPTLDLEADLGIDSIKRVEILNSFRRLLPESKQDLLEDGIEKLAGLKSLQGIMDWIKNDLAALSQDGSELSALSSNSAAALASRSV